MSWIVRPVAALVVAAGIGLLVAPIACGKSDPADPPPIYTVAPITTAPLVAPAGSELLTPLEIVVREPDATPAGGVAVRFRVSAGKGAVLTDTLVATNADGVAVSYLRLGPSRDSIVVAAGVRGQEDRGTTFRVAASAAPELFAVSPAAFAAGDTVSLRGIGLAEPGGTDVLFGGTRGRVIALSGDSVVRAVAPPCLVAGRTTVTVRSGTAVTNALSITTTSPTTPLALAIGEGLTVRGAEAGCVRFATGGERYLLVPQLATFADTIPTSHVYAVGVDALTADRADVIAARGGTTTGTQDVSTRFDATLRAVERDAAQSAASGSSGPADAEQVPNDSRDESIAHATGAALRPTGAPSMLAAPATLPAIGSVRGFRVLTRLDGTAFGNANAKLRYAGAHILLYEDTGAPAPLTDSAATALGDLFDRTLYPLDTQTFGAESDIDENGHVIVLMSPFVNAITAASQCATTGFVRGFFFGVDLDTRNKNSNRAEIFYALTPDPKGERSCPHSLDEVARLLPPVFLHEFQHMISYNQHVLVRRGPTETTWLNEGLSLVAESLGASYYETRYPAPAGRSSVDQLLPDSAETYLRGDLESAALWLAATPSYSVTAFRDFGSLEERGASWLFLRWLGAQKGSGVYARLVQSGLRGGDNVQAATSEPFDALFGDFALAVYADSIPGVSRASIAPRLRLGGYTLRELLASVLGRPFPLLLRPAPTAGLLTDTMVQGTASYYLLTVPPGGAAVRLTTPTGVPIAPTLVPRLGVLRLTP